MKCRTQNLIFFAAAAILVSFLFTCKPFTGGASDGDYGESDGGRITYTNVDYSPDGKSLTLYLDGSTPVRHSRALNYEHAKFGHDLFEVAFISHNGKIARAVWEKGSAAGVSGVERGVNYSAAAIPAGGLAEGYGAAIIFVGKKSDRTLLAVGKLYSVDGGLPGTTTIGPNSRFVTFQVDPLKAGVSDDARFSSFKTNSKGDSVEPNMTDVKNLTIGTGAKDFPLFNLAIPAVTGKYVDAEYKFEVTSPGNDVLNNTYGNGILRGGAMTIHFPSQPELRIPRYPMGDGTVEKWGTSKNGQINRIDVDGDTGVQPTNNTDGNTVFENPATFTIGPTHIDHNSEAFAFSFQIPVYPLTNIDGRGIISPSTPNNFMWYIRPGYDSYWLDLDDGVGNGGAILIGTGQFIESVTNNLIVRKSPNKTRYNDLSGSPNPWNFDLTGILLYLNVNNIPTPVPAPGADVYFIIGGVVVEQDDNILALLIPIAAANDGVVPVTVEYYGPPVVPGTGPGTAPYIPADPVPPPNTPGRLVENEDYNGGQSLSNTFNLYYYAPSGGLIFSVPPVDNRYIIANQESANRMNTVLNSGGSYLLVFMDSFDLSGPVLNGGNYLIIIIAGKENIVLGKNVAGGAIANNGSTSNYFLGIWPFDQILSVDGEAINSQKFYINAAGSQENVNRATTPYYTISDPGAQLGGTFIGGGGTININSNGVRVLGGNLQ